MKGMSKRMLTTSEAAAELGVTPGRIRQMVVDRELPATKFGRDLMIAAEAIIEAKRRKTKPGPKPKKPGRPQQKTRASK